MIDTAAARRLMVDGQVRTADVSNATLLDAMMTIPRERFLPPAQAPLAYADIDVPIANSRVLLKPMVLAKLIQAAGVRDTEVGRLLRAQPTTVICIQWQALLGALVVDLQAGEAGGQAGGPACRGGSARRPGGVGLEREHARGGLAHPLPQGGRAAGGRHEVPQHWRVGAATGQQQQVGTGLERALRDLLDRAGRK